MIRPVVFLLVALLVAMLPPAAAAGAEFAVSPERYEAWRALGEADGLVVVRAEEGRPATLLIDDRVSPANAGEPREGAPRLADLLPFFFAGDPAELVADPPVITPCGTSVLHRRVVAGRPVFGSVLRAYHGPDGTLRLVIAHLPEAAPGAAKGALDPLAARGIAAGELLRETGLGRDESADTVDSAEPEAGWHPAGRELLPAWRVEVALGAPRPAERRYVVSAVDGAILAREDRLFHAAAAAPYWEGTARVYATDPIENRLIDVKIDRLTMSDRLMGEHFHVTNSAAPTAVSPERRFVYDPADTHFDEAMVYHHLERTRRYFAEAHAFPGLGALHAVAVHYGDKYDNAFYSPRFRKFVFGDGDRFNDFAKDAGISCHEYTHAVTFALAPDLVGIEGGAMNEAWSDHFAAVLTGTPRQGAWIVQKLGLPWMRNLENAKRYPEDMTDEIHLASEIYSGALWELRKGMDPDACDRIVHGSRAALAGPATFADGLAALVACDGALHGGANRARILGIFAARGIHIVHHEPRPRLAPR